MVKDAAVEGTPPQSSSDQSLEQPTAKPRTAGIALSTEGQSLEQPSMKARTVSAGTAISIADHRFSLEQPLVKAGPGSGTAPTQVGSVSGTALSTTDKSRTLVQPPPNTGESGSDTALSVNNMDNILQSGIRESQNQLAVSDNGQITNQDFLLTSQSQESNEPSPGGHMGGDMAANQEEAEVKSPVTVYIYPDIRRNSAPASSQVCVPLHTTALNSIHQEMV